MHGLKGGRWGGRTTLWGLLVPGRCAERRHHDGPVGTSTAAAFFQASGLPYSEGGPGRRTELKSRHRALVRPYGKAVVLCLDEKSQIQALDRTQPSLPMKKGRAGTMTHDYKRNGTTTLFAALDVLSGKVIGQCLPQHTNNELVHFLKKVDREVPKGLAVHVITDNYGTRGQENVVAWLAKHPRFHFHFTPTSSSWLNLVERWF
jgi:hypothetical protein